MKFTVLSHQLPRLESGVKTLWERSSAGATPLIISDVTQAPFLYTDETDRWAQIVQGASCTGSTKGQKRDTKDAFDESYNSAKGR